MTSRQHQKPHQSQLLGLTKYAPQSAKRQRILARKADRLLAKSGYFQHDPDQSIDLKVDADAIVGTDRLRATWVGRA